MARTLQSRSKDRRDTWPFVQETRGNRRPQGELAESDRPQGELAESDADARQARAAGEECRLIARRNTGNARRSHRLGSAVWAFG